MILTKAKVLASKTVMWLLDPSLDLLSRITMTHTKTPPKNIYFYTNFRGISMTHELIMNSAVADRSTVQCSG